MKLANPCVKGSFIKRLNRFVVLAKLNSEEVLCHLPNSGRLTGLLVEGAGAYLYPVANAEHRKTKYDLFAIEHNGLITTVDSRLPNKLIYRALTNGDISHFSNYNKVQAEVSFKDSRFDFYLEGAGVAPCFIEVKSAASMASVDSLALFPDAPTKRGTKHLNELIAAKGAGYRAAVIFACQAEGAKAVGVNKPLDAKFAAAFEEARAAGVEAYAFEVAFAPLNVVSLAKELPVKIYSK